MAKNPWLAGLLNLFVWGLGYLYSGKRKVFGGLLLIGYLTTSVAQFFIETSPSLGWLVITIGGFFFSFGFAYDAYNEVKK